MSLVHSHYYYYWSSCPSLFTVCGVRIKYKLQGIWRTIADNCLVLKTNRREVVINQDWHRSGWTDQRQPSTDHSCTVTRLN